MIPLPQCSWRSERRCSAASLPSLSPSDEGYSTTSSHEGPAGWTYGNCQKIHSPVKDTLCPDKSFSSVGLNKTHYTNKGFWSFGHDDNDRSTCSTMGTTASFTTALDPSLHSDSSYWNNDYDTASSSSSISSPSRVKVKPYRFRDEPEKKIIVKTELCRAILEGKSCKFGDKCNFAHTEDELKFRTLLERHEAGLIDKDTYRTRPCLDQIMTGDW